VLRGVVCQTLVRTRDKKGRRAACEVLVNNEAAANLIRKGKTLQLPSLIATSVEGGMQTLEADLARLLAEGAIDNDELARFSRVKREGGG
jgi:twitching motility protein PilT